jgi:hypothetical protein
MQQWHNPQIDIWVNTTIELKNVTTFDNVRYQMAVLSGVVIILSLGVVLTPNGQFVGCGTIVFSKRYSTGGEWMNERTNEYVSEWCSDGSNRNDIPSVLCAPQSLLNACEWNGPRLVSMKASGQFCIIH